MNYESDNDFRKRHNPEIIRREPGLSETVISATIIFVVHCALWPVRIVRAFTDKVT